MVTTLPALFFEQVRARGPSLALRHKRLGVWRRIDWTEYGAQVRKVASALLAFGLAPQERVAILADNRPEWLYCHLAVLAARGITCGIYPTSAPEQIEYLLNHSEARLLFVENAEQLGKVLGLLPRTKVERVIVWDGRGLWGFSQPQASLLGDFVAGVAPGAIDQRVAAISPADIAMVVYTSGTTGPPKGALLSHGNLTWMAGALQASHPLTPRDETMACLPFAHVYENIVSVFQAVRVGHAVTFVERPETLLENLREVSPTCLAHLPRLWEKLMSGVALRVADADFIKRAAYRLALSLSRRKLRAESLQRRPSAPLAAAALLADWLVLHPLRRQLGLDRLRLAICGAAPASPELFDYFRALGVPLIEGYGQTESTGAIALDGQLLPGIEVKLGGGGEVLTRGPHVFQGYLKDAGLTARTIDAEGYLHTGDIGTVLNGRLRVAGRKQDLIVTAGGKQVTPAAIENQLKLSAYLEDAVVIGDRRKHLVALLLVDEENLTRYAQEHRIPFASFAELTKEPAVVKLIEREVAAANRALSPVESVKRFALLPRRFYEEEGDVTPTWKVRRKNLEARYAELIESLYRE